MSLLDGQVAFITGAARGQGRHHAVKLAEQGADIIAVDICGQIATIPFPMATPSDLEDTVAQVESTGRRIHAVAADVRDLDDMFEAVNTGVQKFGRLDIVSANAGVVSFGSISDLTLQAWNDVVDTNLTGVFNTVKASVPHLVTGKRGGSIVITSSAAGLKAHPNASHYVAAKHGLVGLMRSLAMELAVHSIRVNSIHPTQVNTPMIINDATMRAFGIDPRSEGAHESFAAASATTNLLPTPWVEPDDVSNALLFLASDASRFITGVALPVDAGMAIK